MIRVVELFAGVGGFRLGLEGWKGKSPSNQYSTKIDTGYKVVWSNQWEPSTSPQHASRIYVENWGSENHTNEDIAKVKTSEIPDHDLLVGGFPCQDYSVARVLSHSKGLTGKKGVLWWQIHRILEEKGDDRPRYLMLENVDRLLKSPASQRGRDFAIMLASLSDLGYAVEWRVINAAEYGMPQKRRRVFFIGYKKGTKAYEALKRSPKDWLQRDGVIAKQFPIQKTTDILFPNPIEGDLVQITNEFNLKGKSSPFENSGVMMDREFLTFKSQPQYEGSYSKIKDILIKEKEVPDEYFIKDSKLPKWKYLKGAKNEERKRKDGKTFFYKEGALSFPDSIHKPSRTIITSEGGSSPSRSKHVIKPNGRLRRLTPVELERLNMFPDHHTKGATDNQRAFFMGNALVVGIIEKLGKGLFEIL